MSASPSACLALADLRPITAADQGFLDALYASSREDLLALNVDPPALATLINLQQRAQQAGMQSSYPNALYSLVLLNHLPAGRLVVDWRDVNPAIRGSSADVRVVDICIAPACRRQGIARWLLQDLQAQARVRQASITLAVNQVNHAARQLYQSLGFSITTQDFMQQQLIWRSGQAVQS